MTRVTIGNSVTSIGEFGFSECSSLASIIIPDSVTSIGYEAFIYCSSLTSVSIGSSVTNISYGAFYYCSKLTSVTIPDSVTSIGTNVFYDCRNLTNAVIGNGVTNIENGAFLGCTHLTHVIIPDGVTSIGYEAFYDCSSLAGVYFQGNSPTPNNDSSVFSYDPATVYYLPGTTGWGSTFDGRPTALWFLPNPLILNNSSSFGVRTNRFGFTISWATNISVVVQASTNLANPVWSPVGTNTLTGGMSYFSDPKWTNYPGRYYRLRSP